MGEVPPSLLAEMVRNAEDFGPAGAFMREAFGGFDFEGITLTPPTETFEGEQTRMVGDKAVHLLEVGPAHTRGDVIVHVPDDGVVYTGDILFIEGHPIIWAGPIGNWIRACERICEMQPEVVVPGHGPLTDISGVRSMGDYLAMLEREARLRFDAGMPVDEAARDIALDDYASWGDAERIAVNLNTLYREFDPTRPAVSTVDLFNLMAELRADRG